MHAARAYERLALEDRAAAAEERAAAAEERATAAEERAAELEGSLASRDDILARMHQERERAEATVAAAVARLVADRVSPRRRDEAVCMVCFEETESALSCRSGHTVCLSCVERECARLHSKFHTEPLPTQGVPCFGFDECRSFLSYGDCMRTKSGVALVREKHLQEARAGVEACVLLGGDQGSMLTRIAFLRADGTYNARQCSACGYGPILHAHCDDLLEHHDSMSRHGVRYQNACPACHALHASVTELSAWDGRIAFGEASTAADR